MKRQTLVKLIISIAVPLLGGFLSGYLTMRDIGQWYQALEKPVFAPPGWIFGPVWTLLYLAMGVAAFLVWNKGLNAPGVKIALGVFILQLLLNFAWTPVFFGLRSPAGGLAVIVILWFAIVATVFLFWKISTPAALLLVPYLLWVSFATALNYSILTLN